MGKMKTLPCIHVASMPDLPIDFSPLQVSISNLYKINCVLADTEYQQTINPPVKKLNILSNKGFLGFCINDNDFITIMPHSAYEIMLIDPEKTLALKIKSSKADDIIQIVVFK